MLKIGLLSTAHMHAASYAAQVNAHPAAQLVGLWDDSPERLAKQAQAYQTAPFADADELVAASDAVVVCSENVHHRALTEKAAAAGKPVLCEKPLAINPDDARAMVETCRAAGVPLYTAFPCRFSPAFQQLRDVVGSGALGEILAVRGTNRGRCPGGWFVDTKLSGGGAVMDHTVHVTDLLRFLLGSEAKSVFCESDNNLIHGDFDDTGFVAINFESGVFATLDASWSRPKTFPTWGDVTLGVTGTKGTVELDMFGQESVLFSDTAGRVSYAGWGSNIDEGLVKAFVRAVTEGVADEIATGEDGLRAVEVVEAAYESVRTHRVAAVRHR
ncbi:MAG TPA: Gfo/Idh/MocA family oxidoreductase [Armatimonadaceae bacterium]|nr:Gfo/Idh/MocA family oxidoreductase [Armatimonadaceae bacterium]